MKGKLVLEPENRGVKYYNERTDRNRTWITEQEQDFIHSLVIGIAGTGGMGGHLCQSLSRAGVGEIRFADPTDFDQSNLNRQAACIDGLDDIENGQRITTVGMNKGLATAREVRRMLSDVRVVVYTDGICPETIDDFVDGCDLILDEIEFFSVGARCLLHERARKAGVHILNANVVGFGSRLFRFTPDSMTMEELLKFASVEEAYDCEKAARAGDRASVRIIIERVLDGLVPELPEYKSGDVQELRDRLSKEGKAPIFATNPYLSTGLLGDWTMLYLLQRAGFNRRDIIEPPKMPGYLYLDVAKGVFKIVTEPWV